ncbi:MAG: hypothetical protein R1F52_05575 [Candidatus Nitrosoabyssus spongiisocia]|nr:MAG: hypothetical protein R1F52_05575 [Nitrosopumilaceae archaeon AB1(1)]
MYTTKRSNWWFLLPIFLDFIGGIIAYFAIRNDDIQKAKNCLYLGFALLGVQVFSWLIFVLLFEM